MSHFNHILIGLPLGVISFQDLQDGFLFPQDKATMAHVKLLGRTSLQELDLLVKQLQVVKIGTVMIYRRVSGISQESDSATGLLAGDIKRVAGGRICLAGGYIVVHNEHQGALGVTARDRFNLNSQAIFKQQGRFYNLSAAADTNVFITMAESLASNKEIVKMNPGQIEEMVPMEMGNDDIFLEWGSAIARQVVDEIYRLVAGAHVKNPPGGLASNGVNIGTQRACFAWHRRRQMKDS